MQTFSPYPWIATFAFALLLAGFFLRKCDRRIHSALMCAGMATDLTLVLILEFSRNAIATVFEDKLNGWQLLHVGTATIAVALYFPVFALGCLRLFRPSLDRSRSARYWHIRLGMCALVFRCASFFSMFSMLDRANFIK